jgi:putative hydrolase of the HAD superfamily
MSPRAVLFDLFGTLVPPFPSSTRTDLREMAAVVGLDPEAFAREWRDEHASQKRMLGVFDSIEAEVEWICTTLGVEVPMSLLTEAARRRTEFTRGTLRPRDDAVATLEAIRRRGLRTALVSDCSSEVPRLWPETPFDRLIDVPVFSCVVGLKKPDSRIYLAATESLDVAPEDCVYVGDGNSRELSGASALGMRAVHLSVPGEEHPGGPTYEGDTWTGERAESLGEIAARIEEESDAR